MRTIPTSQIRELFNSLPDLDSLEVKRISDTSIGLKFVFSDLYKSYVMMDLEIDGTKD